jgi:hypothetical protein
LPTVGVIRQIQARQGHEVAPGFERRIRARLDAPENAVDRHGRHPYSCGDLGLERGRIEQLLADYTKRFGLD